MSGYNAYNTPVDEETCLIYEDVLLPNNTRCSGRFRCGVLNAIVGGHHSGKKRVWDAIVHYPHHHRVRWGRSGRIGRTWLRRNTRHVRYDATLGIGGSTPRELLLYYAQLHHTDQRPCVTSVVDEFVVSFGLSKMADVPIQTIGPTRSRVRWMLSLAVGVLSGKRVVFIDTTGVPIDRIEIRQGLLALQEYYSPQTMFVLNVEEPSTSLWKEIGWCAMFMDGFKYYEGNPKFLAEGVAMVCDSPIGSVADLVDSFYLTRDPEQGVERRRHAVRRYASNKRTTVADNEHVETHFAFEPPNRYAFLNAVAAQIRICGLWTCRCIDQWLLNALLYFVSLNAITVWNLFQVCEVDAIPTAVVLMVVGVTVFHPIQSFDLQNPYDRSFSLVPFELAVLVSVALDSLQMCFYGVPTYVWVRLTTGGDISVVSIVLVGVLSRLWVTILAPWNRLVHWNTERLLFACIVVFGVGTVRPSFPNATVQSAVGVSMVLLVCLERMRWGLEIVRDRVSYALQRRGRVAATPKRRFWSLASVFGDRRERHLEEESLSTIQSL